LIDFAQLEAIADGLGDLGRRDLLVARFVRDRVDQGDRFADPIGGGTSGRRAPVFR
jgi:hypothetical protein